MKPLRWAILGLGRFGMIHARALQGMPDVELVAASSRQAGPLAERAAELGIARHETDYRLLLDDDQIDVVSIVTHWQQHHELALAALAAGKHVLLEKPMAASSQQCQDILAAAESAAGTLMVGHICRFDPRYSLAREAIQQGRIGEVVSMHARRNLPLAEPHIRGDKISPLMGDGIHDADMMIWMLGRAPSRVFARNIRCHDFAYPDLGWAMLEFSPHADGPEAIGVVETIWCLPENVPSVIDARMQIIGTEGAITIDSANTGLLINNADQVKQVDTAFWPVQHGQLVGLLAEELRYFVACLRDGSQPDVVPSSDAALAVLVMEAAEASAACRQPVEIDLPDWLTAAAD
jgi:UDP-N-acetylglucosamine 3-dehydrogenase